MKRPKTIILVTLLAVALVAVLHTPTGRYVTLYGCPICGASALRTRLFMVPVSFRVKEGAMTRYWRTNVDPGHRHFWIARESFAPNMVADHPGWSLHRCLVEDKMAIAALGCVNSRKNRVAFMDDLWRDEWYWKNQQQSRKVAARCFGIREAYLENPRRRDWSKVLRSLGLPN